MASRTYRKKVAKYPYRFKIVGYRGWIYSNEFPKFGCDKMDLCYLQKPERKRELMQYTTPDNGFGTIKWKTIEKNPYYFPDVF